MPLGTLSLAMALLAMAVSLALRMGGQQLGFTHGQINLTLKGMILLSLGGILSSLAGVLLDEKRSAAVVGALISVVAVVLIPMLVE